MVSFNYGQQSVCNEGYKKRKKEGCVWRNDNLRFLEPYPCFRIEVCNETIKAETLTGCKQGGKMFCLEMKQLSCSGEKDDTFAPLVFLCILMCSM